MPYWPEKRRGPGRDAPDVRRGQGRTAVEKPGVPGALDRANMVPRSASAHWTGPDQAGWLERQNRDQEPASPSSSPMKLSGLEA